MDFLVQLDRAFGTTLPLSAIVMRLAAAAGLSMLIGWEREVRNRPAGLRTHMLVGTGSATFIILALELVFTGNPASNLTYDPTRVIEGVIGGIGFLGAGSIIRARGGIQGLTTAAGIWVVGGIGLACGLGHYAVACIAAAFVIFILTAIGWAERRYTGNRDPAGHDPGNGEPFE